MCFLLNKINQTHLTLIPKGKIQKNLRRWTYSLYKVISRLFVYGFYGATKIIASLKSAFVPNEDINDNILIAHKILTTFSKIRAKVYTWV